MFEFFARLFLFPVAPAAELPDRPEPQVQPAPPLRRRPSSPGPAVAEIPAAGPVQETPATGPAVPAPIRAER